MLSKYAFLARHRSRAPGTASFRTIVNTVVATQQASPQNAMGQNTSPENICKNVRELCKQGQLAEAFEILHNKMDKRGIQPDSYTYASLLQACLNIKSTTQAKLIHAHLILTGFNADIFIETKMVIMYIKWGFLEDARQVFEKMPQRNVVSWTGMVGAYARHGFGYEAVALFCQMQRSGIRPNDFTFASVLPACSNLEALKQIHGEIIRRGFQSDVYIGNSLIDTYAKCTSIEDAQKVFDKMTERNVVSWNTLIAGYRQNGDAEGAWELFQSMPERDEVSWNAMLSGYAQNGCFDEAVKLFGEMQKGGVRANAETFASVLQACACLDDLFKGKMFHGIIIKSGFQCDVFVGSALVNVYAKCGSVENARRVFDEMPVRNVVSWNAMMAGYAQSGRADEGLQLFKQMSERNMDSWKVMTPGLVENQLPDHAHKGFENSPERDVVSWTVMISGFVQNGCFEKALELFLQMQAMGTKPNSDTFASILPACANLGALHQGKELHEDILRRGLQSGIFVGNALIDMYAKCGTIEDAHKVFNELPKPNVISWTTMIVGYAMHGYGKEALQLFDQMQNLGLKPDRVTFVGVLSACCHAGLIEDGRKYFISMRQEFHITPSVEHYCCMVDLLGRAGILEEARDFIENMPMKPDAIVWGCLLSACRVHNNVEVGEYAAKCLLELNANNAAYYVALSNIYAMAGRWDDAQKVRKMMEERGIKKKPGCSRIEVGNKVYTFYKGDRSHPQTLEIYMILENLSGQVKEAGHVPQTDFELHDLDEEQKKISLGYHSEKLAIAFGLINSKPCTPIRIVKNLRVCGDCHSAIKFISKIVGREIIVRDGNRFHHFKDGQCSCNDYW